MLKKVSIFFLVSIVSLVLASFLFLKNGINLDNLSLANVNISQLYIKLDKKLIVTIKTLDISESKKDEDEQKADIRPKHILWANKALDMIELIQIDSLNIQKQNLFVKLQNKILTLKHKEGEANLLLAIKDNDLLAKLNAKSYKYGSELKVDMSARIDSLSTKLYKPLISLDALAKHKDININVKANLKDGILKYKANSNEISNLDFIEDFITLDEKNKNLLANLFFSKIKIDNISGEQNLEYLNDFNLNSLNADLYINDFAFKYDKYPKITQKQITAKLRAGKIDLNLKAIKKDKTLSMDANILSSLDAKDIKINSNIYYKDMFLKANVKLKDEVINFDLSSNRFMPLETLEEFFESPKAITVWTIERLKTKGVQLDNVSGKVYLGQKVDFDFSALRVDARLFEIVMDFNPNKAYPLHADVINLTYDGKDMHFALTNPRSNDVDLTGSTASIYNIFKGKNNGLLLNLQSISPLNWTLVRVVKSYGVNIADEIGLRQTKGKSNIKVKIDIPFDERALGINVKIDNKNSVLKIKQKDIAFDSFHFLLDNEKIYLKDTLGKYQNYNIKIEDLFFNTVKSKINTKIYAYDDNKTFSLSLTNKSDLKEKNTSGEIKIKFVQIKDMIRMKNEIIPYKAKFAGDVDASLPNHGISYSKINDEHLIKIDEFKRYEDFIIPLKKAGIKKSNLEIKSDKLKTFDINLYTKGAMDLNKTYEINLSSLVNLDTNTSDGLLRIYGLKFDDKVDLKDKDIPYNVKFAKDISAKLPSLDVQYNKNEQNHQLHINNLQKLTALVKMLESYSIPKSDIHLNTKDFKSMNIKLNTDVSEYGVFYKKKKQDNLALDINIKDMKKIDISDKNKMIAANIILADKPIINLKTNDLGFEYKDKKEDINSTKKEPEVTKLRACEYIVLDLPKIEVNLKNGYFKYNKNLLNYQDITVNTNKDKIDFDLKNKKSFIKANLDKHNVKLELKQINSTFINNIAGLKAIDGGYMNLSAKGTQCKIAGDIVLTNVDIKNAAILNKIFVVINSAPAFINPFLIIPDVVRFAGDGFTLNNYRVDEGEVIFNLDRHKNILDIPSLKSLSTHNSFYGKAMLDLNQKSIDANMEVSFMQGMASVISYIPVLGYWMLGDDERFSYSVDIKGKLSNPDIGINAGKETLMAPVNIVKRIVTSPAKLVEYVTSEDDNSSK